MVAFVPSSFIEVAFALSYLEVAFEVASELGSFIEVAFSFIITFGVASLVVVVRALAFAFIALVLVAFILASILTFILLALISVLMGGSY